MNTNTATTTPAHIPAQTTTSTKEASPAPAPSQPPELLTPKQLARRLGISRRTLTAWMQEQVLPVIRIGRMCRFDFAKVWEVLAQYEQPAKPRTPVVRKYPLKPQPRPAPVAALPETGGSPSSVHLYYTAPTATL